MSTRCHPWLKALNCHMSENLEVYNGQRLDKSLIISFYKQGNIGLCQNYRTISLSSRRNKVMLRVILNRLASQTEEILKEEHSRKQAGFRSRRSTREGVSRKLFGTPEALSEIHRLQESVRLCLASIKRIQYRQPAD